MVSVELGYDATRRGEEMKVSAILHDLSEKIKLHSIKYISNKSSKVTKSCEHLQEKVFLKILAFNSRN